MLLHVHACRCKKQRVTDKIIEIKMKYELRYDLHIHVD